MVGGSGDALEDPLGGHDLVRPHDQQGPGDVEDAVAGQDVEQRVLGEERLRERRQVAEALVVGRRSTTT